MSIELQYNSVPLPQTLTMFIMTIMTIFFFLYDKLTKTKSVDITDSKLLISQTQPKEMLIHCFAFTDGTL